MSKGAGRVQRSILETLARAGLCDAYTLALHAHTSQSSTTRALRRLRQSGAVSFLGFAGRGVGVWCLPEQAEAARAYLLPPDMLARVSALMGPRFARSLARSTLSMLA